MPSARIFHIAFAEDWARGRAAGAYRAASLYSEGFIHGSEAHQVIEVANRLFRGIRGLVLLHIDVSRVGAEIRHENLEGGEELFPHVYGAIPVAAVAAAVAFEPAADGSFDHHLRLGTLEACSSTVR